MEEIYKGKLIIRKSTNDEFIFISDKEAVVDSDYKVGFGTIIDLLMPEQESEGDFELWISKITK